MTWGTVTNGWGPPSGIGPTAKQGDTDGGPICVAGTTYPKASGRTPTRPSLSTSPGSTAPASNPSSASTTKSPTKGTVRFQVWNGTTTMLTQSAVITGASATATIDINITGINNLRLVVTDNGDGNGYDHADWADAKLTCGYIGSGLTRPRRRSLNVTPPDRQPQGVSVARRHRSLSCSEPLERVDRVIVDGASSPPNPAASTSPCTRHPTTTPHALILTFTPTAVLTANTTYRLPAPLLNKRHRRPRRQPPHHRSPP